MSAKRGAEFPAASIRSAGPTVVVGRFGAVHEEQRIVTFIDLIGSTGMAERLGSVRFHGLLSDVFACLTEAVADLGGEIHRSVGDALIVTWRLGSREQNARPIRALLAARESLEAAAPEFWRRHGEVPEFRASLHCGPLVAAEIGALKGEVALVGDAMNTAARIVQTCRATGHRLLMSRSLLMQVSMPIGTLATSIGTRALPGKTEPVELFALAQTTAGRGSVCPLRACA